MFGKKDKPLARMVTVFSELNIGDLVVFKPREVLPSGISDETLTLDRIESYDYNGKLTPDFTLLHPSGSRYSVTYDCEEDTIPIGNKLKRSEILSIFDPDDFANVFDEGSGCFKLRSISENVSNQRRPWVAEAYERSVIAGIAYYYNEDRRESEISQYEDNSEPFTYFELEGDNDLNSLSIEIWNDGKTDVFCEITVKANVVETFLCNA